MFTDLIDDDDLLSGSFGLSPTILTKTINNNNNGEYIEIVRVDIWNNK